ncbi:putative transcriptional elongation factor iws1 [Erysiphe necator]|uniref:Putative transcriptional elongation factor iws1 n=1 Tax=Uncinula necator TaxID=52586 RepID=A0A0B1P3Y5_UNCNE|nr:putative transcriptional elongation factor iws1 [Erysiphe necator]
MSDSEPRVASRNSEERYNDPEKNTSNIEPDKDLETSHSDNESELSEVDEAEFAEFDPTTVALDDRPLVDIDEDVARSLKASKRKRTDAIARKPKDARRGRKKRLRRENDDDPDGIVLNGERIRKSKSGKYNRELQSGDRNKERRPLSPENEENLTPDEKRRRALDKAMDAALKQPSKRRRKKDEVDLEEAFDDEIAALKLRMEQACEADNSARERSQPAIHKLKMLPEVIALLNRNTVQHSIVDPDTNFLQSVKFFLEPLNDGSLPAYNIQRDIFSALTKLPIEKEALLSSGIGKVILYYTKSKKPEIEIKRTAERLLGEWSRPIMKRSDDYRKRQVVTKEFDHHAAQLALRPSGLTGSQVSSSQGIRLAQREIERERILAQPTGGNRARIERSNSSYTVAPKSTFDPSRGLDPSSRPIGAGGIEAFRKMTAKQGRKRN